MNGNTKGTKGEGEGGELPGVTPYPNENELIKDVKIELEKALTKMGVNILNVLLLVPWVDVDLVPLIYLKNWYP